jgi:hypothetical protein
MFMKRQNVIKWLTLALMICLMCGVSSCRSDGDDDSTSFYVGTWERTELTDLGTEKQVLVMTENTMFMTVQYNLLGEWIDIMVVKGRFSGSGNLFMLTITEIGIPNEELTVISYYTPDDPEWDLMLENELDLDESFEVKIVLLGNQINLITDDNEDGIFDPILEGEIFTKK